MKKKQVILLVKVLASMAFFVVLVSFVKSRELLAVFSQVDWAYFSLSLALSPVMLAVSCLKWKVLFDAGRYDVSFFRLMAIYLVGYFFSNLLPSTVGGDVVRSYYAGRQIHNQSVSAVTVFMERFTGILFLLILVILAPLCKPQLYCETFFYIPAGCAFFLLFILWLLWRVKGPSVWRQWFVKYIGGGFERLQRQVDSALVKKILAFAAHFCQTLELRLEKFSGELGNSLKIIKTDRILFCKIVLLTVLFYILTWVNIAISFRAFGREIDLLTIIALVPTIMFVAHLPVTLLGNLGFFESVFVFYFLVVGVPGAETLAMGLLLRLKMLSLGGVGLFVYLVYQRTWGAAPVKQE